MRSILALCFAFCAASAHAQTVHPIGGDTVRATPLPSVASAPLQNPNATGAIVSAPATANTVPGQVVASGTPDDLGDRESLPTTISYRLGEEEISVETTTPVADLNQLTERAIAQGLELEGLEVTRPNLEDVYLSLTAEGESE